MTKETKIGLLVGLAFIILFAIILSEKGTPQRSAALPTFTIADGSKSNAPLAGSEQPLGGVGRLPVTQLAPIIQPKPQPIAANPSPVLIEEPVAQAPSKQEDAAELPHSVVDFLNKMPIKSEPAQPVAETRIAQDSSPPAIKIPPTVESRDKAEPKAPDNSSQIASATRTNDSSILPTASVEAPKPVEKPLVIKTVHTVQPGESLGKIAAKYYGRSTPARIDAIFKANRVRLKDTHQVKAQQKLDIPDLGEANSAFEPVAALPMTDLSIIKKAPSKSPETIRIPIPIHESTASAEPALKKLSPSDARRLDGALTAAAPARKNKSTDAAYQWYEVRPRDTLSKIARMLLGSEKHSSELYMLNKDRMANKNSLKPGMKLRIPMKSAASDEPQTAVSSSGFGDAD